ncbi:hypothetical protein BREVNS_0083 [Brevinematales bacterium NS]|nr:hypothetical protein [Brevinematales bacterium]QJR20833.1 hypothetical protein BREVNS_0083 [Brevinematales bacterium NS]
MVTKELCEVLEEELLEVVEKKDKDSARHFVTLLLQQVEMKEEARQKENRVVIELQALRNDLKTVVEVMNSRFEAIDKRFEDMNKRFEAIDKRFEDMNKRFEDMNKRFEDMNKRFEDINKRFTMLMWFMGILISVATAIIKWL